MQTNKIPELGKYIEQYGGRNGAAPFKIFILRFGDPSMEEVLICFSGIDHPIDGKIYKYKKEWVYSTKPFADFKYTTCEREGMTEFSPIVIVNEKDSQELILKMDGIYMDLKVPPLEHQAKMDPEDMYKRYIRQKSTQPEQSEEGENGHSEKVERVKNLYDLTDRQIQVIKKIALGYSAKEVGEQLFITPNTVNSHKKTLFSKLNIKNNAGLVIFAIKNGLLDDEL